MVRLERLDRTRHCLHVSETVSTKLFDAMEKHLRIVHGMKHYFKELPVHIVDGNFKGYPTNDPVDFVCMRCGKWTSELYQPERYRASCVCERKFIYIPGERNSTREGPKCPECGSTRDIVLKLIKSKRDWEYD